MSGISFCHDMGVSHRDLKLENTLIFMSPEREPWLKICDFGFSKVKPPSPALVHRESVLVYRQVVPANVLQLDFRKPSTAAANLHVPARGANKQRYQRARAINSASFHAHELC